MKVFTKIFNGLIRTLFSSDSHYGYYGDIEEIYYDMIKDQGRIPALLWYWKQVFKSIPSFIGNNIHRSLAMFKNYLKIALRNLKRHKAFSFINISGLAVGMACCILISLWFLDEINFNNFHENYDNIYGAGNIQVFEGNPWYIRATTALLAPAIVEDYPEVVDAARIDGFGQALISYNGKSNFESRVSYADPSIFNIFSFDLVKGTKASALADPHSVVLTEEMAEKYFEDEDPIGKYILLNNETEMLVSGVVKSPPVNSSIKFNILVSFDYRKETGRSFRWRSNSPATYLLLADNTDWEDVDKKFRNYVNEKANDDGEVEYHLIPMKDMRFSPFYGGRTRTKNLSFYSIIAIIILLIACINFMNLTTARSAKRAKEVGIRKVVGAYKKNLIYQFLGESIFMAISALVLAVFLVIVSLPYFNNLFLKELTLTSLTGTMVIPTLIAITLITGIVGGSYPALFLSSFKPVSVLKGNTKHGSKNSILRKGLVVLQFVMSISLIIGTKVIYDQLDYMKNKGLGYEKEHVLSIYLKAGTSKFYTPLKNLIKDGSSIVSVTGSTNDPTWMSSNSWGGEWDGQTEKNEILIHIAQVDYDYTKTMKIEMVEGRDFSPVFSSDESSGFLVNEEMVKLMGKDQKSVVSERLKIWDREGKIVGVMKDFNFVPLDRKIPPLVLFCNTEPERYLIAKINPQNVSEAIEYMEESWNKIVPDYPFEFTFLDADVEAMYRSDERTASILKLFAIIGIIIASMGIYGLAAFVAEQRTKEIGIRKVLGASSHRLINMLIKDFVVLVIISIAVSIPIAHYYMSDWLSGYEYRITMDVMSFLIPGIIAMALIIFTVFIQAFKAANANPIDAISYE